MQNTIEGVWRELSARWEDLRQRLAFWGPTQDLPGWMAPTLAIGALLALVVTAGVAVAATGVLLTALLVAHLILDNVFGVSIALVPRR